MMKKYRRLVATVVTSVLLGATLIGCGGSGSGDKATSTAGKTSGDQVNLTFSIWDTNQQAGMQEMADAFTKENANISVKVEVTPWDQYWTKLQAAATGSALPDIFWMHPEQVFKYQEGDVMMDITDRIDESGVDMSKFPQSINDGFNIEGKQYAIPKDYSTIALFYNKDLFDAAGVDYPDDTWTWDDWTTAAEKLTDKDQDVYGMLAPSDGQNYYFNLIWQNGSDLITKDEKKSLYDDPKTIEAIKFAVSFIEKGYAPTTEDLVNTSADQRFETGKAAMITAGSWMCPEYSQVEGLNIGVAPMPKQEQRGSICGGMGYSIAANTSHPEEAWKFLQFLAGKEANVIQANSGAAIPAYEGAADGWVEKFPNFDAQVFVDAAEYGFATQYVKSRTDWAQIEQDALTQIFALQTPVEQGCKDVAKEINDVLEN